MRRLLLVVLSVIALASCATHPAPRATAKGPDLSGSYRCEGVNPDGHTYTGTVEIRSIGVIYVMHWTLDGGEQSVGVALLEHEALSVSITDGSTLVVAVYQVDGAILRGQWSLYGSDGQVWTETLTRSSTTLPPNHPPIKRKPEKGEIKS